MEYFLSEQQMMIKEIARGITEERIKPARAELDESKRKEMYWEMQRIVRDEGATIIPIYVWFLYPASEKLGFENVASNWELDGFRIAERWWFKS